MADTGAREYAERRRHAQSLEDALSTEAKVRHLKRQLQEQANDERPTLWVVPEGKAVGQAEAKKLRERVQDAIPEYRVETAMDSTEAITEQRISAMLLGVGPEELDDDE